MEGRRLAGWKQEAGGRRYEAEGWRREKEGVEGRMREKEGGKRKVEDICEVQNLPTGVSVVPAKVYPSHGSKKMTRPSEVPEAK
jgi:hypothetical protein